MEKRLLGIEELSEYIGIRPQTIRNRLSCGTFPIPAKKVCGRVKFDLKDVEKAVEWCRHGPPGARVQSLSVNPEEPTGESGFEVRYG